MPLQLLSIVDATELLSATPLTSPRTCDSPPLAPLYTAMSPSHDARAQLTARLATDLLPFPHACLIDAEAALASSLVARPFAALLPVELVRLCASYLDVRSLFALRGTCVYTVAALVAFLPAAVKSLASARHARAMRPLLGLSATEATRRPFEFIGSATGHGAVVRPAQLWLTNAKIVEHRDGALRVAFNSAHAPNLCFMRELAAYCGPQVQVSIAVVNSACAADLCGVLPDGSTTPVCLNESVARQVRACVSM